MRIQLGETVKDKVTGFKGVATSRCEMLNGCTQYEVTPKVNSKGEMQKAKWIDDMQLEILGKKKVETKKTTTGGPMNSEPKSYGEGGNE